MKKLLLFSLFIAASSLIVEAQNATAMLDIANFRAPIRSDGQMFQNFSYSAPGLEWPKTTVQGSNSRFISYTAQLWMSATDLNGTKRIAANVYGQNGRGYYPGLAGCDPIQNDFAVRINRSEVDQFKADFLAGNVNFNNYPVIQAWPSIIVNLQGDTIPYAPFVNVDGMPGYDPNGGDYPDMPGDQAVFFGFTDDPGQSQATFADYLGVDITGFAYAFACPSLENVLYVRYEITNRSGRELDDFTVALWHDADLGNYQDDAVGTDTTSERPMMYFYNLDANDETASGYGLNPPAIGYTLLSEPAYSAMTYSNDLTVTGNPLDAAGFDNYLHTNWLDSTHLTYGGTGHLSSGLNTNFALTGDPGFCNTAPAGWNLLNGTFTSLDPRALLGAAPQPLPQGHTKRVEYAFLMARDFSNQNLGSVCKLMDLQDSLVYWYLNQIEPCDGFVLGNPESQTLGASLSPNPSHGAARLRFENTAGELATCQIMDLQGRAIGAQLQSNGAEFTLETQDFAQGLYLVQLRCGEKHTVIRLMKAE